MCSSGNFHFGWIWNRAEFYKYDNWRISETEGSDPSYIRMHPLYFDKIIVKWMESGDWIRSPPLPSPIFIYISWMNLSIIVQQAWRCVISLISVFYVFVEKAWIGSNRNSIFSRVNERCIVPGTIILNGRWKAILPEPFPRSLLLLSLNCESWY